MTAIIGWVGWKPGNAGRPRKPKLDLRVGGLRHDESGSNIYLTWVGAHVKPGDTISVRVGRGEEFDQPASERIESADEMRRAQANYLEHLAPQHGWVKRPARRSGKRRRA